MAPTYDDLAWTAVLEMSEREPASDQQTLGPIEQTAAHSKALARFAELAVPPHLAAALLCEDIRTARATISAGLDAYAGLVANIELASDLLERRPDPDRVIEHLLQTKARIAHLYHFIAGMAPLGGVGGVASIEVTAAMVAESDAELAEWHSRAGQLGTSAPSGDGGPPGDGGAVE